MNNLIAGLAEDEVLRAIRFRLSQPFRMLAASRPTIPQPAAAPLAATEWTAGTETERSQS